MIQYILIIALNLLNLIDTSRLQNPTIKDDLHNKSYKSIEIAQKNDSVVFVKSPDIDFPYEVVFIPLNKVIGIPTVEDNINIYLNGFEVDEEEVFYFLSGQKATLMKFNKYKAIGRYEFNKFYPSSIYLNNDTLFIFDNKFKKNNLFCLSKNGEILYSYDNIIDKVVNNYIFYNSFLILNIYEYKPNDFLNAKNKYYKYTLSGKFLIDSESKEAIYGFEIPKTKGDLIGTWNDNLIMWKINNEGNNIFFKVDKSNNKIDFVEVKNIFDFAFYGQEGNPLDHCIVRNEKIYMLGKIENNAAIIIIPLEKLFKNRS